MNQEGPEILTLNRYDISLAVSSQNTDCTELYIAETLQETSKNVFHRERANQANLSRRLGNKDERIKIIQKISSYRYD